MAANKFATMLHKNCHKITLILVYTFLEWILILFLLLNSSFSFLIRKFANFFGLKQSCTCCSTLDHIFDTKKTVNSQFDHVCEAHGAEISKLSFCTDHKRLAESNNLCTHCPSSKLNDIYNGEENRCSCCDEILSRKVLFKPSWDVLDYVDKKGLSSQSDLDDDERGLDKECKLQSDAGQKTEEAVEEFECDDPFLNRSNEDDESGYLTDMLLKNADSDRFICIELIDTPSVNSQKSLTNCSDSGGTTEDDDGEAEAEDFPGQEYSSREDVMTRIKGQEEALKGVYEERRAAEETMAMITKLQEEKAAMQMEAIQYQRMMEEQAEYDQEALQLLNDLLIKRDKEKKELEKELQIYQIKVLDYHDGQKTAMIRTRNGQDLEFEKQNSYENVSLAEFDDERLSILEQVKILEAKLFALHDDETEISRNGNELDHDHTIDVIMTKKLLPLFDATEFEESGRIWIEEELGHVYKRLQALEEDNDFLKHCIRSMMKGGNEGLILVQEILQHLRDLKSVELSATNMAGIASSAIMED